MGIFGRIQKVLSSNLNSLLDDLEDPAKQIAQTVRDMRRELKTARQDVVQVRATAKRLRKEADEAAHQAADWENKAVLAVRAGDDDLARQALKQKARTQHKARAAREDADRHDATAERMEQTLEQAERRIAELDSRQGSLAAQVARARQQPTAGGSPGSRVEGGAFSELERLSGSIERMEAEVEAADVLQQEPTVEQLQARFAQLEEQSQTSESEDELAELKKRLDG